MRLRRFSRPRPVDSLRSCATDHIATGRQPSGRIVLHASVRGCVTKREGKGNKPPLAQIDTSQLYVVYGRLDLTDGEPFSNVVGSLIVAFVPVMNLGRVTSILQKCSPYKPTLSWRTESCLCAPNRSVPFPKTPFASPRPPSPKATSTCRCPTCLAASTRMRTSPRSSRCADVPPLRLGDWRW